MAWAGGALLIGRLAAGQTYVRTHFRWGFYADTSLTTDLAAASANIFSMGLVTTIGDTTETVPNARTSTGDAAPPSRRWIYLETRAPVVTAIDSAGGLATWRDSGSSERTDTRGQVLAPAMPGGSTLNLWFSWAAAGNWDATGTASPWLGYSLLYKT
jgi:hypothetical protein